MSAAVQRELIMVHTVMLHLRNDYLCFSRWRRSVHLRTPMWCVLPTCPAIPAHHVVRLRELTVHIDTDSDILHLFLHLPSRFLHHIVRASLLVGFLVLTRPVLPRSTDPLVSSSPDTQHVVAANKLHSTVSAQSYLKSRRLLSRCYHRPCCVHLLVGWTSGYRRRIAVKFVTSWIFCIPQKYIMSVVPECGRVLDCRGVFEVTFYPASVSSLDSAVVTCWRLCRVSAYLCGTWMTYGISLFRLLVVAGKYFRLRFIRLTSVGLIRRWLVKMLVFFVS